MVKQAAARHFYELSTPVSKDLKKFTFKVNGKNASSHNIREALFVPF